MALAIPAGAGELRIHPEGLPLRLEVQKTGLWSGRKHQFEFPRYEGRVEFDPSHPARSRVELVVQATEFRLLDTWVSEKDRKKIEDFTRSREMLDVARYPTIEFRSTAVEPLGGDRYRMGGQLQIRGISKPIQFEVHADRDDSGSLVEGRSLIRMSEFGLKPPSAALGLIGTKDDLSLEFRIRVSP
jgi:polyisoprenoid-binding protein YceI